ncbi:glycosyl transferase family 2 [Natranaeroarchaeum aerophilus]|uniref:Glycosyl transferase family 2 n=1 Tax=Natranaeroarchaeum aerophilus TaxID=2917711 RepID=A0AAE3K8B5_9EURY|nr:glycosyl transferase family 2 [Natranaeroarchaeum aerophilus]MCL9814814.1 glycosyl transferase family 2 [Natranaeroarchaeum aerophilus]
MEYVQERIATVHDFTDPVPSAPTDSTAVVVPMTHREHGAPAAERTLSTLSRVDPATVVVPLRAPPERVDPFREWLDGFAVDTELLWCNSEPVESLLARSGVPTNRGKGRDVWLALGAAAADHEYIVVHDADATTYSAAHVPRLLAPLGHDYSFSKGYYARIEDERLYGRLFRLFVAPLIRALSDRHHAPVLRYLDSFRYALAGEFAMTAELAQSIRAQPSWGLEIGTLGEAFDHCGFEGTAQVDLGFHEHDHRAVRGETGLADMAEHVGDALFRVLDDHGLDVAYGTLPADYRRTANRLVEQYALDASMNGLAFDAPAEREQVAAYSAAVTPPGEDERLPAWKEVSLSPVSLERAAVRALDGPSLTSSED